MAAPPPHRFRYGAFAGGPDPLQSPFDVRRAVDELGERVLSGSSVRDALEALRRNGSGDTPGVDEIHRQIRERRRQLARRGDPTGELTRARAMLDQAIAQERDTLATTDDDAARLAELTLDAVPTSPAAAIRELADYSWRDPQAKAIFDQIARGVQEQILEQQFRGLKSALGSGDPAQQRRLRDMLADLNALLADHARGQDTPQQFDEFMDKHAEFFPENPSDVDELIDELARRQAEMQRLMRSLSADQRRELEELMDAALAQDVDLAAEMAQLTDNLQALRPGMMSGGRRPGAVSGDEPLGLGEAAGVMGELADLEELEAQLAGQHPGATLDDVDLELLERQLGAEAAQDVRALRDLERELQRQGYLADRSAHQDPALSPKALRRLGQSALGRIFADLRAAGQGTHDDHRSGAADERTGAFLPWEFGDERPFDAVRSAANRIGRSVAAQQDLDFDPDDFVIAETERRTRAAVALCVDLSFSMVMEDRWLPMKQTAIALTHLISTRFRQDALEIIGFDATARTMTPMELLTVEPEWIKGTNLQHALLLAGRHLRKHPEAEPVVLVITDGEPTAHLEDGIPVFSWPPTAATVRASIAQVDAISRQGASLNIFRLGDDPGLARFVDGVARRSGGRVFAPDPLRLGEFVISDYLRARRGS